MIDLTKTPRLQRVIQLALKRMGYEGIASRLQTDGLVTVHLRKRGKVLDYFVRVRHGIRDEDFSIISPVPTMPPHTTVPLRVTMPPFEELPDWDELPNEEEY